MPMIDVYAPEKLIPSQSVRDLGLALTHAILRAEGVAAPGPFHLNNTAFFFHTMPAETLTTAAGENNVVRVQIITPPKSLSREGQIVLVKEVTELIAKTASDPSLEQRTWVLLSEAAEGGWGIAGTAFGREEFLALAARAKQAQASS
jgi:phenylpyruvate tautomerase PptA (4-oxalocrotonate tautomerase family)